MRISTKGRHAVMAMTDLARNSTEKPVSLADVARRQEISLSYLEQLIARLKSQGLVKSIRGPGGGYWLNVPAGQVTVYEIIHAVDDRQKRIHIDDPLTATGRQLTELLWQAIGDEVRSFLKTITLDDVVNCTLCETEANSNGRNNKESGNNKAPLVA